MTNTQTGEAESQRALALAMPVCMWLTTGLGPHEAIENRASDARLTCQEDFPLAASVRRRSVSSVSPLRSLDLALTLETLDRAFEQLAWLVPRRQIARQV